MIYYYANASGETIDPATASLIQKIRPGGVLISAGPGRSMDDFSKLVSSIKKPYEEQGAQTPFIGADFLRVKPKRAQKDFARSMGQDLGFGTRITYGDSSELESLYDDVHKVCLATATEVKAFFHHVLGINHPLGPQVEEQVLSNGQRKSDSKPYLDLAGVLQDVGVVPTLKHYPFTIEGMDGHKTTLSPKVSEATLKDLEKTFFGSAQGNYVVMTTHVGTQDVDGGNIATFSKPWVDRLRAQIGQKNLIMTDGLFMIGAYPNYLSKMSGLSEEEIDTYFKGNEYDPHDPPMFPWRYGTDPVFQAVKGVLRKYNDLRLSKISSLEDAMSSDPKAKARWEKQQRMFEEFGRELADALAKKKGYRFETKTIQVPVGMNQSRPYDVITTDDPKAQQDFTRAMSYNRLLNGEFDPDRAQEISAKVVASFAEHAIRSGHDLLIIEGNPIDQIYSRILKDSCANTELREKIETAAARIKNFKAQSANVLEHRATREWIVAHRDALEFLAFELFPKLNDPKNACRKEDISAVRSQMRCLGF